VTLDIKNVEVSIADYFSKIIHIFNQKGLTGIVLNQTLPSLYSYNKALLSTNGLKVLNDYQLIMKRHVFLSKYVFNGFLVLEKLMYKFFMVSLFAPPPPTSGKRVLRNLPNYLFSDRPCGNPRFGRSEMGVLLSERRKSYIYSGPIYGC